MNLDEYSRFDATGLAELVARGEMQSHELARLAVSAVEMVNPELNAVVEIYEDRLQPCAADGLPLGPFRGVPILNKDLAVGEEGRLEEMGSPLAQGHRHSTDSLVWSRFREAGFLSIGRTATAEFGVLGVTENRLTGITRNPWDIRLTPGGSSGGSAAIVAAGAVPMASGGDGGGSIRIPAAYCGIVGLKPSRGRISQGAGRTDNHVGISTPFALTRSIRDCAQLLDCMECSHPSDPYRLPLPGGPFTQAVNAVSRPLTVGYLTQSWYGYDTGWETEAAVHGVIDHLRHDGHCVREVALDFDYTRFVDAALDIWSAGLTIGLKNLSARHGRPISPQTVLNSTYRMFNHGCALAAETYIRSLAVFQEVNQIVATLFGSVDLLVLPTSPQPAPVVGYYDIDPPDDIDLREWHRTIYVNDGFTGVFNVSGNPAISVPFLPRSDGLPVGVQIVAPFAREDRLLQIVAGLERAFPWSDNVAPLHVTRRAAREAAAVGQVPASH